PVLVLQTPTPWHWSLAVQTTGVPVQRPAWQVSPVVHARPSLQAVPLGRAGWAQRPVVGVDAAVGHESMDGQTTGVPVAMAAWQVSPVVHARQSLQVVLLGAAGFEHMPVVVSQVPAT